MSSYNEFRFYKQFHREFALAQFYPFLSYFFFQGVEMICTTHSLSMHTNFMIMQPLWSCYPNQRNKTQNRRGHFLYKSKFEISFVIVCYFHSRYLALLGLGRETTHRVEKWKIREITTKNREIENRRKKKIVKS